MDATAAAVLGGVIGLLVGVVGVVALMLSERRQRSVPTPAPASALPAGVADVLAILRSSGIVVDATDRVVNTSPAAVAHGLVRGDEVVHPELRELARQVRRDGVIREVELDLPRGPLGRGRVTLATRVAPLGGAHVLLLLEDRTQARRVEEVRRDFVANVSHELKTPVGGMALLAEAVLDARDDPDAVARFAGRLKVESTRLAKLVQEIVDLSRLQVADTLHEPVLVDVSAAAAEAVDRSRLVADARRIELRTSLGPDATVFGDRELVVTAISNLVANAVSYSADETRVAITVRRAGELVEIAVTDQGQGIPEREQGRIFERFYRVDAARSRATGGTGLGLAIVKHICANHGGDVTVWSQEGRGSTFTIRIPAAPVDQAGPVDQAALADQPTPVDQPAPAVGTISAAAHGTGAPGPASGIRKV